MKKTVIVIALMLALFAGLFVALPVMATPPEEQKIPVRIVWAVDILAFTLENRPSDGLSHRLITIGWKLDLYIGDAVIPIHGTADCTRHVMWAYAKLQMAVYQDEYVISFPTEGGGFEGTAHLTIYDWITTNPPVYNIKIHALFQGTGAFEGQTLNVGVDKGPANLEWEGYLSKP
ncbi:MAG TPA: hypothetical protein VK253_01820 [Candidatus Binatia bacterium]|nr:hypothetical protein [Candidatus Binatia bacterium]